MALYIPHSIFPFGAAFVCQAGKFWTLLDIWNRGLSPSVKQPVYEADHSHPRSVNVKNEWSFVPAPPTCLHDAHSDRFILMYGLYENMSNSGGSQNTQWCELQAMSERVIWFLGTAIYCEEIWGLQNNEYVDLSPWMITALQWRKGKQFRPTSSRYPPNYRVHIP